MNFLNTLFQSIGNLFGGGGGGGAQQMGNIFSGGGRGATPTAGGTGSSGGGNNIMSLFGGGNAGQTGIGLGALGLGQLLNKKVNAPNLNTPQVQSYQSFTQNPPQLPQSMQGEINNSLQLNEDEQLRNLRNVYKNLRPGTDYTTDSTYQRDLANLQRGMASNRANAMMGPTLQYLQPQQQALHDQAEMSMYQPMMQYGADTSRREGQNSMFSNIGSTFLKKGLGINDFKLPGA